MTQDRPPAVTEAHRREAIVRLVREALEFCDFAAGEGICREIDGELRGPEDFLSEFANAVGLDDWDTIPTIVSEFLAAAERRGAPQWLDISSAPENTLILLYFPEVPERGNSLTQKPMWMIDTIGNIHRKPTHWQPLPAAPEPPR
jgi:hypothetical protein